MHKVGFPERKPSVCFVCTAAPSNTPFVDTTLEFETFVETPLSGRKYLCESCVQTAADALGLFDKFKTAHDEHEARVKLVESKLDAYAHLETALSQFGVSTSAPPTAPNTRTAKKTK